MSRKAYALKQLETEVTELYPKAQVSYGDPDGLDVIRSVTFKGVPADLNDALGVEPDPRIATMFYDRKSLTVEFQASSPLADRKDTFSVGAVLAAFEDGSVETSEDKQDQDPDGSGAPESEDDGADGDANTD